ncbi:MAG: DUF4330 domain-containing protein [Oscillospiraceae bacterium]|nr:DUF4330 domain-containing protein [Oscillospiraceae bacterium]
MSTEKRAPRFNIVDALVLAAVLLVAAGVCYQLFSAQVAKLAAPKVKLSFVATSYNVRWEYVESLLKEQMPDKMVAGNSIVPDALVTGISYRNSVVQVDLPDGTVGATEDPVRFDVTFTMEAVIPSDNAILKVGAQEVRVGKQFIIKTKTIELAGMVTRLSTQDL